MVQTSNRLPYSLDTLGRDQLQQILERFSKVIPFPLIVANTEGKPIAVINSPNIGDPESLRLYVDKDRYVVEEGVGAPEEPPSREILSVPVSVHDEVIGYIIAYKEEQSLDDEDKYKNRVRLVADFIADKAYAEYELKDLTEELVEKFSEITLIYEISEALGAVLNPITVCEIILEKVVGVVGVGKASIMLYDEASDRLYIAASHGIDLSEEEMRRVRVASGEGVSGKVFATGSSMLIENTEDTMLPDLSFLDRGYKKKSFLSIPMIFKPMNMEKKVMGVINMTDKESSDMFTSGDLRLLTAIASQAAMSLYNIQLIEEVKDAERVKREMEIAQQIQMGLLPSRPPELPGLELAGRCLPATQIGGDYYDFFPPNSDNNNKLGLVIADVSGHNVGAALMMATVRSTLRSEVLARKSPARILQDTNFALYEDLTHAELFITMFYAEYDTTTKILRYSNGGHNHPIILRNGTCIPLNTEGMLVGVRKSVDFEEKTICLEPNDFVIFYTDGVVEAKNEKGKMFTDDRLRKVIRTTDRRFNAYELLERIYDELKRYSGNAEQSDDITLVVLKIH